MQSGVWLRSLRQTVGIGRRAEKTSRETDNRSAAMGHDVASVRRAIGRAAGDQADNGPADVGVVFDGRLRHVGNKTSSATPRSRAVRIDDGLTPVELLE